MVTECHGLFCCSSERLSPTSTGISVDVTHVLITLSARSSMSQVKYVHMWPEYCPKCLRKHCKTRKSPTPSTLYQ